MKYILFILFLFSSIIGYSQKWEFGFQLGGTNYIGDLSPNITLKETNPAYGVFVKRNISPFFSHNFAYNNGKISGNDLNFKYLAIRNLSFFTNISEFSYSLEFNFLKFALGLNPSKYSPYTFIGLGVFSYEPKVEFNGNIVKLSPLDTEGKKVENTKPAYALYQLSIPVGGGFKIKINKDVNFALSVGFRYSFTDYLDDVSSTYYNIDVLSNKYGIISAELSDRSDPAIGFNGKQRGRSDIKDWYIFSGATLSFVFKNKPCFEF